MELPVLGICYGLQLMAYLLGGKVSPSQKREYGFASLQVVDKSGLLSGIKSKKQVWMSHGDRVIETPHGFRVTGRTENCEATVIEWSERRLFGVQFHPEVIHSRPGKKILSNFLFQISGLKKEWNMESFIQKKSREISRQVGDGRVLCGLSGGIDSLVASLIIQKAVNGRLYCVFVDNGLLR